MSGTSVRQSIVRSSVLPTVDKGTQVKNEIAGGAGAGAELNLAGAAGLSQLNISSTVSTTGVHQEINGGTTVRPSIVRSSVLPTIDGGVKVLKTIFGGVRQSTASAEEAGFGAGAYTSTGATVDLGTTTLNTVDLGTKTLNTVDLGTTTLNTVNLGTTALNTVDLGTTALNTVDLGTTATGAGFEMGAGAGAGFEMAGAGATVDLGTVQGEGAYSFSAGNTGMQTTTTTTTTTSQYGMGGAEFSSGAVMGVTEATHDGAVDVTYSTKPGEATTTTLNTLTTSTTVQPYTTTKVLKPIYNNTVRPAIVSNTVLNPMLNNFQPEVRNSM